MIFECEELVELCPRLETAPVATATFDHSGVTQTINQTGAVVGSGSVAQAGSNFAGAAAVN